MQHRPTERKFSLKSGLKELTMQFNYLKKLNCILIHSFVGLWIPAVQILPLRMKWKPDRTVSRALMVSEPPIFVHFMPTRARTAPKKPRHTAAIIRPRHTWI